MTRTDDHTPLANEALPSPGARRPLSENANTAIIIGINVLFLSLIWIYVTGSIVGGIIAGMIEMAVLTAVYLIYRGVRRWWRGRAGEGD